MTKQAMIEEMMSGLFIKSRTSFIKKRMHNSKDQIHQVYDYYKCSSKDEISKWYCLERLL